MKPTRHDANPRIYRFKKAIRFWFEIGWFSGEDFCILGIIIGSVSNFSVTMFELHIAKAFVSAGFDRNI